MELVKLKIRPGIEMWISIVAKRCRQKWKPIVTMCSFALCSHFVAGIIFFTSATLGFGRVRVSSIVGVDVSLLKLMNTWGSDAVARSVMHQLLYKMYMCGLTQSHQPIKLAAVDKPPKRCEPNGNHLTLRDPHWDLAYITRVDCKAHMAFIWQ